MQSAFLCISDLNNLFLFAFYCRCLVRFMACSEKEATNKLSLLIFIKGSRQVDANKSLQKLKCSSTLNMRPLVLGLVKRKEKKHYRKLGLFIYDDFVVDFEEIKSRLPEMRMG